MVGFEVYSTMSCAGIGIGRRQKGTLLIIVSSTIAGVGPDYQKLSP
jgi:hypothetical protein